MSKKLIIVLSIVVMVFMLIFGIGGKMYMDNQAHQEQLRNNLSESKKQIKEILEWNFDGIKSIIFDYLPDKNTGLIAVPFDKSLSTTPAGGLIVNGYVNGDKTLQFTFGVSSETMKHPEMSYSDTDKLVKDHLKIRGTGYLEQAWKTFGTEKVWNTDLDLSDVEKLKVQGYTSNISAEQIIKYLEEKNGNTN